MKQENMNKTNQKHSYRKLVLEQHKKEKQRLFSEAKKPKLKVPMLQIDGVLMTQLNLEVAVYCQSRDDFQLDRCEAQNPSLYLV